MTILFFRLSVKIDFTAVSRTGSFLSPQQKETSPTVPLGTGSHLCFPLQLSPAALAGVKPEIENRNIESFRHFPAPEVSCQELFRALTGALAFSSERRRLPQLQRTGLVVLLRVLALTPLNTASTLEVKLRFGEISVSSGLISLRGGTPQKKLTGTLCL